MEETTRQVGGAFVVGGPVALTFEELLQLSYQRPVFPGSESDGGDPLSGQVSDGKLQGLGQPVSRDEWFAGLDDERVFRLGVRAPRRHLIYDVYFSMDAIGLTLAYKEHIFVQALSGLAARNLGIIAKGDIIISASCSESWIRCVSSLNVLTDFIREKGRPLVMRFWRRPEPLPLHNVLHSPKTLEVFVNFINKYLESPNYREVLRSESMLEHQIATTRLDSDHTDTEDDSSEDDEVEEYAPRVSSEQVDSANKYLNSPMAQLMFLVEVVKINRRTQASQQNQKSVPGLQEAIRNGIGAKYLVAGASDFSIRDLFSHEQRLRNARREVLTTGSMAALDVLFQHVSNLVRNDAFALFLHDREAERVLELLGEKNGWKLRVYSYLVRVYVPIQVVMGNRCTCSALILFLLSQDSFPAVTAALPSATLWYMARYGNSDMVQNRLRCPMGSTSRGNLLTNAQFVPESEFLTETDLHRLQAHVNGCFEQFRRNFFYSEMGVAIHEAFSQCIQATGDYTAIDKYMPRLSTLLRLNSVQNLVLHRSLARHDTVPCPDDWMISHAMVFRMDAEPNVSQDPTVVASLYSRGPLPAQIERFFVPHGSEPIDFFDTSGPFMFNFIHGSGLYACSLVIPYASSAKQCSYAGICIATESKKIESLRAILREFNFGEEQNILDDPEAALIRVDEAIRKQLLLRHREKDDRDNNGTGTVPPSPQHHPSLSKIDFSLRVLFEAFALKEILLLFECVLLEKKILLVSERYSVLTVVAESLRELIAPISWCHVFAPVLPRKLLDHVECPTPFIIGINVHYAFKKDFPFVTDAVVVDIDTGIMHLPTDTPQPGSGRGSVSNAVAPLPTKIKCRLLDSLNILLKPALTQADMIHHDNRKHQEFPTRAIRIAFRNTVEELVKNIVGFCTPIVYQRDSVENTLMVFEEAKFVAAMPPDSQQFYSAFMRTQGLSHYIASFL